MRSQLRDGQKPGPREVLPRTLAAGLLLLFELPLLLPLIVGWVLTTLLILLQALTRGRRSGPHEGTL
jgi:hypothetical protein